MKMCSFAGLLALAAVSSSVNAAVVIQDTFTGTSGTDILSHTADVSTGTYSINSYTGYAHVITADNMLKLGASVGVGMAFTLDASSVYSVSLDFNIASANYSTLATSLQNGVGAGFFSNISTSASQGYTNYTGVSVNQAGGVKIFKNGSPTLLFTVSDFDYTATHSISYQFDSATGALMSITLDGTDYVSGTAWTTSTAGYFTTTTTAYAGIYTNGNSWQSSIVTLVDNYQVATVPEPASLALLSACGLLLVSRKR